MLLNTYIHDDMTYMASMLPHGLGYCRRVVGAFLLKDALVRLPSLPAWPAVSLFWTSDYCWNIANTSSSETTAYIVCPLEYLPGTYSSTSRVGAVIAI